MKRRPVDGSLPGAARPAEESPVEGENAFARWSRRKLQARRPDAEPLDDQAPPPVSPAPAGTDADMPPLEGLDADSDYAGFFSPEVSESLRRQALRKLFHLPEMNVVDELDDYAGDYTSFVPLGDVVTADMRHALERLARKQSEAPPDIDPDDIDAPSPEQPVATDADAAQRAAPIDEADPPPDDTLT